MGLFSRKRADSDASSPTVVPELSKEQIKRATRTRKTWTLITSFFLFVSVIFLILVNIGGTYNKAVIRNWYFLKLDLSNIVPASVPNSGLINTIAQTLGLHDFYQIGLWGYCSGYGNEGVTFCSEPKTLYWFNVVEILTDELLAGATINLPADINDIMDLIKLASNWMFGLFLTGTVLSFILMFLMPISVFSRWLALLVSIFAFFNALFITAASIVATVMFIIFRNVISSVEQLNIGAEVGVTLFAFMWVASAFAIFAWLVQMGLCCCCASRRDVKTGRKRGSEKAYQMGGVVATDGPTMQAGEPKVAASKQKRFWQRS